VPEYRNFETYLRQDHHEKPKEAFVVLGDHLSALQSELPEAARVLDVGCATGALIGYLQTRFTSWDFTGLDISEELLKVAESKVPQASFVRGSAVDLSAMRGAFDIALCIGVLGVFDEEQARDCLIGLTRSLRPGGLGIVFGQFNDVDVDVQITHRKRVGDELGAWESGWSNYSQATVQEWLQEHVRELNFEPFRMPFSLQPQGDPVRTWTIPAATDDGLQLTNGLKLLVDLRYLIFRV
jgi:ubiquinone/menaquinone biosynthesis C-methylase UbiE